MESWHLRRHEASHGSLKPVHALACLLGASQILWLPSITETALFGLAACCLVLAWAAVFHHRHWALAWWLVTGLLWALLHAHQQNQQQHPNPSQASLTVRVDSLPKTTPNKVSFIGTDPTSGRQYQFSHYANQALPHYQSGHWYQLEVNIKPPHGTANGVGFDREKWLFRHGIDGLASIKHSAPLPALNPTGQTINGWRQAWSERLDQAFIQPRVNALVQALTIGDKTHFSASDRNLFQQTGTAHLIAISGLHIGMVAWVGWLLGAWLYRLWPQPRITRPLLQVVLGLLLAAAYAALAGFTVATQRALVMLLVYGLMRLSRRPTWGWDVWSVSLLVVLLLDPMQVLDAGFWLSFTAVAILILAFAGQAANSNRWWVFTRMQFILLLGMLPLSLLLFTRINLLGPWVNLLMIPLMTFVLVPLLLLLLLLGSVWATFPGWLVTAIDWVSLQLLHCLDWFHQFDGWSVVWGVPHGWQFLLIVAGVLWLLLPRAVPQRAWGLLLLVLGLIRPPNAIPHGHLQAHFLDVGQALSVLIRTQNHNLLYDVGAAHDSGFNLADAVVIPYLQQQHIGQLDALVLSHRDNDHSGAANALLRQVPTDMVWGTEDHHQACVAGQRWQWDGVTFEFLSPLNLTPYLRNNSSCVLKISNASHSLLLPGDIEAPVEYRLTQQAPETINADVMLMPHHGSKTSSTDAFLDAVNPSWVINSSGAHNPFNHPAPTVVQRYTDRAMPILDTQQHGLLQWHSHPTPHTRSYRARHQRIWRAKKPE
ncbi:DNA internalization-related competence protein ComEC/Rec2 [Marinicella meishanensis]|uniref:DNA internalization-related competence protein ComEC/Rec2 n=1 Tax=Marinicella meishanensis TaxID=2873263 RepID=UPI001CC19B8C|nr:DNA internalization-related competence protein ComEC/Rec2 [Marinicella sp. NBU2979]